MTTSFIRNRRILIIDDQPSIHEDIRKILRSETGPAELDHLGAALFGTGQATSEPMAFEIDSAYQGAEGMDMVLTALSTNNPYAMAFVDMRMPPGWDGLETIERIWQLDPDLQVVICTAYTDHPLNEIHQRLGYSDRLLMLKKPFENVEVYQLASALTEKWNLAQQLTTQMRDLTWLVHQRALHLDEVMADLRQDQGARTDGPATQHWLGRQLRQIQKMEIVGRLMEGTAVELNNLLTGAMGCTSLAMHSLPKHDKAQTMLDNTLGSVRRAGELIRQLVAFTQLSCLERSPTSLPEVIATVAQVLRRSTDEQLVVQVQAGPDLRLARADIGQLYQILLTVCLQAKEELEKRKAQGTLEEDRPLIIEVANIDCAEDFLPYWVMPKVKEFVMVTITYPGKVPELVVPSAADQARQNAMLSASPLKLALAQSMIKDMGGWMTTQNTADGLAVFKVNLPTASGAKTATPDIFSCESKTPPGPTTGGSETVLFIDDQELIQFVVKYALEPYGYKVLLAKDGTQGLTLLANAQPPVDLVILDLSLPGMTGAQVLNNLQDSHPNLRVLLTSGCPEQSYTDLLPKLAGVLPKPFETHELLTKVREILDRA